MTLTQCANLEITLHRAKEGGYSVDLRFEHPNDDETRHLRHNQIAAIVFDCAQLRALALDPVAYGNALSKMLFTNAIRQKFAEYRAHLNNLPMRIRLAIGTDANELHGLRWETLRDPEDGSYLLGPRMPFSRYISTSVERFVSRQYRERLRTLIAIANPRGVTQYGARAIDTSIYLDIAHQIVGAHERSELSDDQASLEHLTERLEQGCDLLYIVAHGGIIDGEPCLALARGDGEVAFTSAQALVHCIRNLSEVPRLAILVSCESAGATQAAALNEPAPLVALGPLLAEAGIPAVIAMQGRISSRTATRFLSVFVEALQRDGIIDSAAAYARASVHDHPDAWMPVLFMRSKSGVFWQRQQPGPDRPQFDKWRSLIQHIKLDKCVPILGPGLLEPLVGSTSTLAAKLAQRHKLQIESPARESLPQVAQLLELQLDRTPMRSEIADLLYEELALRSGEAWPDPSNTRPLHRRLKAASDEFWRRRFDPYQALARLPFPFYVNSAPDSLLEFALESEGKQPYVVLCPWSHELQWASGAIPFSDSVLATGNGEHLFSLQKIRLHRNFIPDRANPIIYHPFGLLQILPSLVLTADDYFQYLVGNTKNQGKMPPAVRHGLTASALVFLGFQLNDWGFRVLIREILQLEGSALREGLTHVAVQIDPSSLPYMAHQQLAYVEEQLHAHRINVYWGSPSDFLRRLEAEYATTTQTPLRNRTVSC